MNKHEKVFDFLIIYSQIRTSQPYWETIWEDDFGLTQIVLLNAKVHSMQMIKFIYFVQKETAKKICISWKEMAKKG